MTTSYDFQKQVLGMLPPAKNMKTFDVQMYHATRGKSKMAVVKKAPSKTRGKKQKSQSVGGSKRK